MFARSQADAAGGLIVLQKRSCFIGGRKTAPAGGAGGVARRGESSDDRLGIGNELPVEGTYKGTFSHSRIAGVPVGVTHDYFCAVAIGEDLIGSPLRIRI